MTHSTTMAIRAYSRDEAQTDAYEALLDYYGKTNLLNISEEMGLAFLQKLRFLQIELMLVKKRQDSEVIFHSSVN